MVEFLPDDELDSIIEYFFENKTFGWMFDSMFVNPDDNNYGPNENNYTFLLQDAVAKYINKYYDLVWEYDDGWGKVEVILVLGIKKYKSTSWFPSMVLMLKTDPSRYWFWDDCPLPLPIRRNSYVSTDECSFEDWANFNYDTLRPVFSRIFAEETIFTQKGLNDVLNDIKERSTNEVFMHSISKLLIERIMEASVRSYIDYLVLNNSLTEKISNVRWLRKPDLNLEIFYNGTHPVFGSFSELKREDFDFNKLLKEVLSKYAHEYEGSCRAAHPYCLGSQLDISDVRLEWLDSHQKIISGYKELLRLVLENLLENAIHNSSPRHRKISIRNGRYPNDIPSKEYPVVIVITDNGAGIAPEHLDSLGDPFLSYPTKYNVIPGRGLGLFAVREIIRLHEGVLAIESKGVDQGCTVIIKLPRAPQPKKPQPVCKRMPPIHSQFLTSPTQETTTR